MRPAPTSPAKPRDLAAPRLEAHADRRPRDNHVLDAQEDLALGALRTSREVLPAELAAHHHRDDLVVRRLGTHDVAHVAPVAHHGDAIGELEHLFHPVRDVDDADSVGPKLANDAEKMLRFAGRQGRRRLVHDDDAGVQGERLRDLHHLHLARRQTRHGRRGRAVEAHALEQATGLGAERGARHGREEARSLAAEEDVGRDVEIRRQHQLLMNQRDTETLGLPHAVEHDGLAVEGDRPFVRQLRAAEDLHQRALAGAVLAHQRQHLSRREGELHPPERDHTGKALGDRAHFEQRGGPVAQLTSSFRRASA